MFVSSALRAINGGGGGVLNSELDHGTRNSVASSFSATSSSRKRSLNPSSTARSDLLSTWMDSFRRRRRLNQRETGSLYKVWFELNDRDTYASVLRHEFQRLQQTPSSNSTLSPPSSTSGQPPLILTLNDDDDDSQSESNTRVKKDACTSTDDLCSTLDLKRLSLLSTPLPSPIRLTATPFPLHVFDGPRATSPVTTSTTAPTAQIDDDATSRAVWTEGDDSSSADEFESRIREYKQRMRAKGAYLEQKFVEKIRDDFRLERERDIRRREEHEASFLLLQSVRRRKQERQEKESAALLDTRRTSQLYSLLTFRERVLPVVEEPALEVLDEKEEDDEVWSPLTEDEEGIVTEALRRPLHDERPIRAEIRRRDLETLTGTNWLNDEVMNEFFAVLERSESNAASCKCMSTFFFAKLQSTGYKGVKRWTKKIDIFAYDLILVPVHLSVHWTLIAVDLANKRISFLDSLVASGSGGGASRRYLECMSQYLAEEYRERKGAPLDVENFELKAFTDAELNQQGNGSDCGMFACKFAEMLAKGRSLASVTQERMPYFRRRMMLELICGSLLTEWRRRSHSSQTNKR